MSLGLTDCSDWKCLVMENSRNVMTKGAEREFFHVL